MLGVEIKSDQKMFVGYGDYQEAYHAFIQGLNEADPYLCGQQFTTVDVMVAALLFWQLKIGQIQTHPVIEQYLENVKQRESYQKFIAFFSEPA